MDKQEGNTEKFQVSGEKEEKAKNLFLCIVEGFRPHPQDRSSPSSFRTSAKNWRKTVSVSMFLLCSVAIEKWQRRGSENGSQKISSSSQLQTRHLAK